MNKFRNCFIFSFIAVCLMLLTPHSLNAQGVAAQCGSANGQEYGDAPTNSAAMCNRGVPSSATLNGGTNRWVWTCTGSNAAAPVNCSADNCGTSTTSAQCVVYPNSYVSQPALDSETGCLSGTFQEDSSDDSETVPEWRWRCLSGVGGSDANCTADRPATTTDGVCGTANGTLRSTAPSGSILCDTGSASPVSTTPDGDWSWTCSTSTGLAPASCSAFLQPIVDCNTAPDRDIMLVVDDSGSIGATNFATVKTFIKSLTDRLALTANDSIGLAKFSTTFNHSISPTSNVASFKSAVDAMTYVGAGTYIDAGLHGGANMLVPLNNNGNSKTVILISDGISGGDPIGSAQILKDGGYKILSVAIGNFDKTQMDQIKSPGTTLFNVEFSSLNNIVDSLAYNACNTAPGTYTYTTQGPTTPINVYNGSGGGAGGAGGSGCFAANTAVLMADGTFKNINELQVDDMVMAFDKASANSELKPQRVTHVFETGVKDTYDLFGTYVTGGHKFMTGDGEMLALEDMTDDTMLVMDDGSLKARGPLVSGPTEMVYNITVENSHSYVANGMRVGNMTISPPIPEGSYTYEQFENILYKEPALDVNKN